MGKVALRRKFGHMGYRFQKHHGMGIFFVLLIPICLFGVWSWYTDVFSPVLKDLCESKANRIGQETVHRSVSELLEQEEYLGSNFLRVEKNEEGNPTLVLPDTAVMNRFRSQLALLVSARLHETKNAVISIPFGNLTGIEFFSNRGPHLQLDAYPYGEVFVEIFSHFSDAGVNQTRHCMTIKVTLDIAFMLPGQRSYPTKVVTMVPLSETVVVGSVPNSYTNLESDGENVKDDLLNLIDD
ncbi:MAG: sporulation protein YunB [Ruminococcaceae bacterium]|nr:sporulation protein YunB [Oscillospiraceae bacterium]